MRNVTLAISLVAWLGFVPLAYAQRGSEAGQGNSKASNQGTSQGATQGTTQQNPQQPNVTDLSVTPTPTPEPPKEDPEEAAAYKSFTSLKPDDVDQQIKVGEQFLQKYPTSPHLEGVYGRLAHAYFSKEQYDKMFSAGQNALQLNGDDVAVLTLLGWVVPHNFDPNDPGSADRLAKAELYCKHALEIIPAMPRPEGITDEVFAQLKGEAAERGHSGLGLVYFREGREQDSITELQAAVTATGAPDPVDYYVMGMEQQHLTQYSDAVVSLQKCVEIPSGMQDDCKQLLKQAKQQAATALTKP